MLLTPVLDVAIGLSFFFLLLALICTTVNEMWANWRKTRSKFLDQGIDRLLGGNAELKKQLYEHPLIKALRPSDNQMPSYLPPVQFARAILDIVAGDQPLTNMEAVRAGVAGNAPYQKALKAIVDSSPDAAALQKNVEEWFNTGMDRVSGWYKKNAQANAFILACLVTLIVNADALSVIHILWTNPTARATAVELAAQRAKEPLPPMVEYPNPNDPTKSKPIITPPSKEEQAFLADLTGWEKDRAKFGKPGADWAGTAWGIVMNHFLGWLITAIAVSLGAPFWFDTLNRFMAVRNAGRAPDEPRDKSSSVVSQPPPPQQQPPAPQPAKT